MPQWSDLSDEQKNWERNEIARLPEIMAGLGIELHPIRPVRLYGKWLANAPAELDQLLAAPASLHCSLIVDLDEPDAVRAAARALSLPSLSLWLFSSASSRCANRKLSPPTVLSSSSAPTAGRFAIAWLSTSEFRSSTRR
jgi:hypothetical protein